MAYYQTKEGRVKKRLQNGKSRRQREGRLQSEELPPVAKSVSYDAGIVDHVRMVTSLLEGRKVNLQEVLEMLARAEKRQQGMGGGRNIEYRAGDLIEDSS